MNILYLAHRIPFPPDKGDKLRAFRQLEHLTRHHRVWCACFVDRAGDEQYVEQLREYCQEVHAVRLSRIRMKARGLLGLATGRTVTETAYDNRVMRSTLHRWAQDIRFDAVVAFSSSMAPHALRVPAGRHILDLCDLDSRKWLDYAAASSGPGKWLYQIEGRRLAEREKAWIEAFDAAILITQAEANLLETSSLQSKVRIVGNGVVVPDLNDALASATGPPAVGFVGVMDYRPNVDAVLWFVEQCWAEIRQACPTAVFRVIGQSPTPKIRRLANVPGVQVVGKVENILEHVARLNVSVAPMQIGRGLQNKVLEAMAAARPVVLTSPAAEGIAGRDGTDYVIADTTADTVSHVVRLLTNSADAARIGHNARRFVIENHCWIRELDKFEAIVKGIPVTRSAPRNSLDPVTQASAVRRITPAACIGQRKQM